MDLQEQLKNLFPDHIPEPVSNESENEKGIWLQDEPILCKFEKRKGKPITILAGYNGSNDDFKKLAQEIKKTFNTGGSIKNDQIIIQGNFRDKIMGILINMGFNVKRVGG